MSNRTVTLDDRFDLSKPLVLLNGTQALVRLMLMQRERDVSQGLNTAGYVTGYRGSPLGAVDYQMSIARSWLDAREIRFHPGLNEDLAATALWGTQQANLRGEGKFDGVFGLWYGKGPGVDRSGDVLRHANFAGTSPCGGVLMALGDDHTGESSTTLHQSELTLIDSYIPVLSPAGVQEVLDYGIMGFALSRYSGNWVGLKCIKDTIEATSVVDGRHDRMAVSIPDVILPGDGLNIRLHDTPRDQELRTATSRKQAAIAFARANDLNRCVLGKGNGKIAFVAAGKNWLDLRHALDLLDLDEAEMDRLGLSAYKVGMVWPFDKTTFLEWASEIDLIIVVEEKRKLIEIQIRDALFESRRQRVFGYRDGEGRQLFPGYYALDPSHIALKLGGVIRAEGLQTKRLESALHKLESSTFHQGGGDIAVRKPYFCSGCPHNTSTRVPEESRAYAGIGCHYMVQWMDRRTIGFTHMGGEGGNWIGEAPFSERDHVFQNIGDGTYNHSGIQAIRAAMAADVNITYKILFNDAVAMTGGQRNDGGLDPPRVAHEVRAIGVQHLAVVYDKKERPERRHFPGGTAFHERGELDRVQERFARIPGVSVILYIQTCAAEKRRRRKRGQFPDPDRRVFINSDVCEGCGDCGVQSNCVAVLPLDTPLGRKRRIDQSSCNKDYSCLLGFCPSFVTVVGGRLRKVPARDFEIGKLPHPVLPEIAGTYNLVISGIGGTGVVTVGAVLSMAAHIGGMGVGMIEMAGLAQKGGAVNIHCRIANVPSDISAIRIADGEADAVIAGDLVVASGAESLSMMARGRTRVVLNTYETMTGDFTRDRRFRLPTDALGQTLRTHIGEDAIAKLDANSAAKSVLGDSIYSNMLLLGAAWQAGIIPVGLEALRSAIRLNGAAIEQNLRAFEVGRWSQVDGNRLPGKTSEPADRADVQNIDPAAARAEHLLAYQGSEIRDEYLGLVKKASKNRELRNAVAVAYHRLLAVKDEYEVARLLQNSADKVGEEFTGDYRLHFHVAPPIFAGKGRNGRPAKIELGSWAAGLFALLASLRWMRNRWFDPFRYTRERKLERRSLKQYQKDMEWILELPPDEIDSDVIELAALPDSIRGFGPVKEANRQSAERRRQQLVSQIRSRHERRHASIAA